MIVNDCKEAILDHFTDIQISGFGSKSAKRSKIRSNL